VNKVRTAILVSCLGSAGFNAAFWGGAPGRLQSGQPPSGRPSATSDKGASRKPEIEVQLQDIPKELELEFRPTMMGEMLDQDGQHLGFSNYTASDGTNLTAVYEYFFNAPEAHAYFEKELAKAAGVIERKSKLNSAGAVVGERALVLKRLGLARPLPAVLWTDGLTFHEIYSSSLKSILQLEKGYRYTVPDHIR